MRLPDFLVIGAARCGTTSLYEYLKPHPQVFLPASKRPEPHFFLKQAEYEKGLAYYSEKYFSAAGGGQAAGEISTSYIYQPYVPGRIKAAVPGVKLIAILRNPIERAFSGYHHTRANGLETLPFGEAIRKESQRIARPATPFEAEVQPFAYIDRGRYARQLKAYLGHFPRRQIHVVLFEDFARDALKPVRGILAFLGVASEFTPPAVGARFNEADYGGEKISPEDRQFLYDQLKDDIAELAALLKRDLSDWR